jgi:hypothetical protein
VQAKNRPDDCYGAGHGLLRRTTLIDIELPDIDLPELDDPLSDEELEFLLTFKVEFDPDEFGNDPLPPAP